MKKYDGPKIDKRLFDAITARLSAVAAVCALLNRTLPATPTEEGDRR